MTASTSSAITGANPTPEQWATVYARWHGTISQAAKYIKVTLPALTAARLASALIGAYPTMTPDILCRALAVEQYPAIEIAPAIRPLFAGLTEAQMTDVLIAAFPAIMRAELDAALRLAGYLQTPPFETWLSLSGAQQFVDLQDPPHLNITGVITIEAWITLRATDGIRNIVARGYALNPNGEIFLRIIGGAYQIGTWQGTSFVADLPIPTADVGSWVHLAGVYDGSVWRLYRNGVLAAVSTPTLGAQPVASGWAIGARGPATERFFGGDMGEVRIWKVARSQAEIQANLWRRLRGDESGLAGYWPLDEGSGGVATDRGPAHTNGAITGATWQSVTQPSLPPTSTALAFNGSTSFVQIAPSEPLNKLDQATWEVWMYPLPQLGQKKVIWREFPSGVQTVWENGTIAVGAMTDQWRIASAPGFPPHRWYHVAGVLNGAALQLFINGELWALVPSQALLGSTNEWHFGRWNTTGYDFAGQLSEVRIWKLARSQAEIQSTLWQRIPGNTPGLVGYWRLDDGFGSRATDMTINADHAVLQDTIWQIPAPHRPRAVRLLNGGRIALPSNGAYNFGTGDFTLEVWIKTTASGTLISRKSTEPGPGKGGFLLVLSPQGNLKLATDNGSAFYEMFSQPTSALDNQWHHVAGVRQGGQLSLFFDGTPLPAIVRNNGPTPMDVSNDMRLLLGATDQAQEPYNQFVGVLGEVRIWNVARSRNEIWNAMDQSLSGSEPGLVGYWPLDQAGFPDAAPPHNNGQHSGSVQFVTPGAPYQRASVLRSATVLYYPLQSDAGDASGNQRHGTLNGQVSFAAGRFGQAANFMVPGASITLPDLDRYANSYTLSAWVYLRDYLNIDSQPSEYGTIFGRLAARYRDGQLQFAFYYDNAGQANNQALVFNSNSRLMLRQWQHVAVTYNHDSLLFSIYIDGKLDLQQNLSDRIKPSDQPHLPWYCSIGGWPDQSYSAASTLNGSISDAYLLTTTAAQDDLIFLANPLR